MSEDRTEPIEPNGSEEAVQWTYGSTTPQQYVRFDPEQFEQILSNRVVPDEPVVVPQGGEPEVVIDEWHPHWMIVGKVVIRHLAMLFVLLLIVVSFRWFLVPSFQAQLRPPPLSDMSSDQSVAQEVTETFIISVVEGIQIFLAEFGSALTGSLGQALGIENIPGGAWLIFGLIFALLWFASLAFFLLRPPFVDAPLLVWLYMTYQLTNFHIRATLDISWLTTEPTGVELRSVQERSHKIGFWGKFWGRIGRMFGRDWEYGTLRYGNPSSTDITRLDAAKNIAYYDPRPAVHEAYITKRSQELRN